MSVKTTIVLDRWDIIEIKTAGGAGYGRPERRPRSRIKEDLENGIVTRSYVRLGRHRTSDTF
ncbi:hypothetical protein E6H21_01055 [Candidatus Bathyarchaeota archaeon]|nr:MAG: hypothetical protein E6H21_01055 [Candidatus Bathyarchaeota archaeon]